MTAEQLIQVRKSYDVNRQVWARALKIPATTVVKWETGENNPTRATIALYALLKGQPADFKALVEETRKKHRAGLKKRGRKTIARSA